MIIASCKMGTTTVIYAADIGIFLRDFITQWNTIQCLTVSLALASINHLSTTLPQTHSCTHEDSDPLAILPSRPIFAHISHTVLSLGKLFCFF